MNGFEFQIPQSEWDRIQPKKSGNRWTLDTDWTDVFAKEFSKKLYSCVLSFKSHRINDKTKVGPRCAYMRSWARCIRDGCPRDFKLDILNIPDDETPPTVTVR